MVFCVGLTGGIGCGKSLAAEMFAELGAAIVDTDAISRELTGPGGEAIPTIEKAFGKAYVRPDGSLDRAAMRKLVFADADARARLESILHPRIRAKSRALIDTANAPYAMLVVPLLLETGAYKDVINRVLVVDCDEARQIERVMARGLSENDVRSIIRAQIDRSERVKQADDVIANDGDINELRKQVRTLHLRYLELARA
jgi:dephospho-CoA kinase